MTVKLDTRAHRYLTSREIAKILGWIPMELLKSLGLEETRQLFQAVLIPLAAASAEESVDFPPTAAGQLTHLTKGPDKKLILCVGAAIGAIISCQANAYGRTDQDTRPIYTALQWISNHLEQYQQALATERTSDGAEESKDQQEDLQKESS